MRIANVTTPPRWHDSQACATQTITASGKVVAGAGSQQFKGLFGNSLNTCDFALRLYPNRLHRWGNADGVKY